MFPPICVADGYVIASVIRYDWVNGRALVWGGPKGEYIDWVDLRVARVLAVG